jgi:hypothetical protein
MQGCIQMPLAAESGRKGFMDSQSMSICRAGCQVMQVFTLGLQHLENCHLLSRLSSQKNDLKRSSKRIVPLHAGTACCLQDQRKDEGKAGGFLEQSRRSGVGRAAGGTASGAGERQAVDFPDKQ